MKKNILLCAFSLGTLILSEQNVSAQPAMQMRGLNGQQLAAAQKNWYTKKMMEQQKAVKQAAQLAVQQAYQITQLLAQQQNQQQLDQASTLYQQLLAQQQTAEQLADLLDQFANQ